VPPDVSGPGTADMVEKVARPEDVPAPFRAEGVIHDYQEFREALLHKSGGEAYSPFLPDLSCLRGMTPASPKPSSG